MKLRLPEWLEAPAIAAQQGVIDAVYCALAGILAPKLNHSLHLPQHAILSKLDGPAAIGFLAKPVVALAPLHILVDDAVQGALTDQQPLIDPHFSLIEQLDGRLAGFGFVGGLEASPEITTVTSVDTRLPHTTPAKDQELTFF
jgi:hypothetical protein